MKRLFGWILPNREIIECEPWNHMETVRNSEKLRFYVSGYDEMEKELDSLHEEHEELARLQGDTNAEWHIYELAMDEFHQEVYHKLLLSNVSRMGELSGEIHIECSSTAYGSMKSFFEDFAEQHNKKLNITVIKTKGK